MELGYKITESESISRTIQHPLFQNIFLFLRQVICHGGMKWTKENDKTTDSDTSLSKNNTKEKDSYIKTITIENKKGTNILSQ